ncbi:hypothetical protein ACWC09_48910 [Streptomyces sp. NPDC001617]
MTDATTGPGTNRGRTPGDDDTQRRTVAPTPPEGEAPDEGGGRTGRGYARGAGETADGEGVLGAGGAEGRTVTPTPREGETSGEGGGRTGRGYARVAGETAGREGVPGAGRAEGRTVTPTPPEGETSGEGGGRTGRGYARVAGETADRTEGGTVAPTPSGASDRGSRETGASAGRGRETAPGDGDRAEGRIVTPTPSEATDPKARVPDRDAAADSAAAARQTAPGAMTTTDADRAGGQAGHDTTASGDRDQRRGGDTTAIGVSGPAGAAARTATTPGPTSTPRRTDTTSGAEGPRLFPHDESDKLQLRLRHAVSGFVDGPRDAVAEADQVVEEIAGRFVEAVTRRRRTLRMSWQEGDAKGTKDSHPDTEQLRLALRDYRDLAERLLHG